MDLEQLQLRAKTIQKIRQFFIQNGYLETDTPALSSTLIPETCLEVFKTQYHEPWSDTTRDWFLVPSPEIYMKKIIAKHKVSIFQISKCYRNVESIGNTHNPEFTMLEYYTINADYLQSAKLTEQLFKFLRPDFPDFAYITMDEAFKRCAGFYLSECPAQEQLFTYSQKLDLPAAKTDTWEQLYNQIFVHCVEPQLANLTEPAGLPLFLMDYPAQVACLAKDIPDKHGKPQWKERWELYIQGIELANCYTEETESQHVRSYFITEAQEKAKTAKIPHPVESDYWKIFNDFPPCSGVAMGVDRLLMILSDKKSIESVLPFLPD